MILGHSPINQIIICAYINISMCYFKNEYVEIMLEKYKYKNLEEMYKF